MTSLSRRGFIGSSGLVLAGAAAVSGRSAFAAVPEAPTMTEAATQAPLVPTTGPDYQPVATLNGWSLPWRMNGDWKEFHLVAEPVVRELAPGMKAYLWGYNGQSPGPTIEAVEGDKVRIYVTNKLPENTAVHWHGQRLPNGMDGVGGLTQPHIPPGKTFVYEFLLRRSGTFMYHPHSDEMVQMAMGMMGFFVVHPKDPAFRRVDRDFVFLLNAFDIEPGSYVPRVNEMTDFNMWCWNSRVFPGIDPFVVGKNDKVRIRFGNLTMTNHPIHLHGYEFKVSCTSRTWPARRGGDPPRMPRAAPGKALHRLRPVVGRVMARVLLADSLICTCFPPPPVHAGEPRPAPPHAGAETGQPGRGRRPRRRPQRRRGRVAQRQPVSLRARRQRRGRGLRFRLHRPRRWPRFCP